MRMDSVVSSMAAICGVSVNNPSHRREAVLRGIQKLNAVVFTVLPRFGFTLSWQQPSASDHSGGGIVE